MKTITELLEEKIEKQRKKAEKRKIKREKIINDFKAGK